MDESDKVTKQKRHNMARSIQRRAAEEYKGLTAMCTVATELQTPKGKEQTAMIGHADAIFKAFCDIYSFRDHYLWSVTMQDAIREASDWAGKDPKWQKWASDQQRVTQHDQLTWSMAFMAAFMKETEGNYVWDGATRKRRRQALRACFDEAPLYIASKLFCRTARRVDLLQIYGLDANKSPQVKYWRRFIRMVFVDLCDAAYPFAIRPSFDPTCDGEKQRWNHWKLMTHSRKYKDLLEKLGSRYQVPVYPGGLKMRVHSIYVSSGLMKDEDEEEQEGSGKERSGNGGTRSGRRGPGRRTGKAKPVAEGTSTPSGNGGTQVTKRGRGRPKSKTKSMMVGENDNELAEQTSKRSNKGTATTQGGNQVTGKRGRGQPEKTDWIVGDQSSDGGEDYRPAKAGRTSYMW